MSFSPKTIWEWYKNKPKWLKIILFVFVIIIIVFIAIFLFAKNIIFSENDIVEQKAIKTITDSIDESYVVKKKKMQERERENKKVVNELEKQLAVLEAQRKKEHDKHKNKIKEIDSAATASDVVNIINDNRPRNTKK